MNSYTTNRAYTELHFSVILWGFTGILGRLITIDSTLLVWYRMLFTVLSFLLLKNLFKQLHTISQKTTLQLLAIGAVVALHWVTFFGSIHLSNVSVAVGCLATTSLFTAFLEPFFSKQRIKWVEVFIGGMVTLGLGIMFFYGQQFSTGIIIGLISALLAGLFTTLNKVIIDRKDPPPKAMSFLEMGGGWIFLCLLIPLYFQFFPQEELLPDTNDFLYIFILAIGCTTLPFILSLRALKKLSAFNSVLAINLEPIYSIALAILIFQENEEVNWRFYLGTGIVILAVFSYPVIERLQNKRTTKQIKH